LREKIRWGRGGVFLRIGREYSDELRFEQLNLMMDIRRPTICII
jgi:hypothetical protein